MHVFRIAAVNAIVLMGATVASLSAADPWIGAWTLNRTKSHVTRAEDMPLDSRLVFVDDKGQQRLIEIGRDMHRKPVNKDCAFRQDGRDNQVRGARRMGAGPAHGRPVVAGV